MKFKITTCVIFLSLMIFLLSCGEERTNSEQDESQQSSVATDMAERDTLFYDIEPEMIEEIEIQEEDGEETEYRIMIQLKEEYHSDYEQVTNDNIGNSFAVVHQGEVVSPAFPTIQTGISGGQLSIGPFSSEEEAKKVHQQIMNE